MSIEFSVLKLETLQKQFSLAMKQYKDTFATYDNIVKDDQSLTSFVKIPGQMYNANPILKKQVVNNETKCEALCSADKKCKGATYYNFLNSEKICATYGGIGESIYAKPMNGVKITAIYSKLNATKNYLEKINKLNTFLLTLHSQILNVTKSVNPDHQRLVNNIEIDGKNLEDIYMSLNNERKRINKLMREYDTLEGTETETSLRSDSNYMYYRIFFIVAVIIVFVTLKQLLFPTFFSNGMTGGGKSSFYDLIFNFILMVLLLVLAQTFKHSAGYILWALFVLTYIFIKLKVFKT
jgi:hypothetical protein